MREHSPADFIPAVTQQSGVEIGGLERSRHQGRNLAVIQQAQSTLNNHVLLWPVERLLKGRLGGGNLIGLAWDHRYVALQL